MYIPGPVEQVHASLLRTTLILHPTRSHEVSLGELVCFSPYVQPKQQPNDEDQIHVLGSQTQHAAPS